MAFNPEDFKFERILPPEEVKPILEWDALHRLILVRVKEKEEWVYLTAKLEPQINKNLHDHLPDEWSHENDRIVSFSIYEDGTYLLEKEKLKFDFDKKSSKWIRYEYKDLDLAQVKELFDILKAVLAVQQLDTEVQKSKAIVNIATREEYFEQVEEDKIRKSKKLLRASDWTQLPDATETFSGELELWSKYRNYIRDNVKKPSDFDDVLDFLIYDEEFRWPIDPFRYHELDPKHEIEYLSISEHFTYVVEGSGTFAAETLLGNIKQAAAVELQRQKEGGISVQKQIWDKIQQYKLNDGLTGAVIENLKVEGI